MKICKVSRKSLLIYAVVFFLMLFFEAQRLNPLLERESAKYPFLRPVQEFLTETGEKSGLYALSSRMYDTVSAVSQNSLFSENRSLFPVLQTWLDGMQRRLTAQSGQNSTQPAEQNTAQNTALNTAPNAADSAKQNTAQTQPAENSALQKESLQNQAERSQTASRTKSVSAESSVQKTAVPAQNSGGAAKESAEQKSLPPYKQNSLGYPFNTDLLEKNQYPEGSDIYHALMPDFGRKKTVLLIGDSMMMEGLGPTLHHRLRRRDNLDVYREGKYSSGLSRPDFYDWPKNLAAMLEKYSPDLLIMSLGANDTQDIVIDKKRYFIDTKPWAEIYLQRSKDFIALADNGRRHIVWVSLPVMGKEPYFTRTRLISRLQAEASRTVPNASFVNIEHLLTENGRYTTFYKDKNNQSIRLRSQDLIHVSNAGGEILTDYVLPEVDRHLAALYAEDVPQSYPPAAGMANRVTFTSELRRKQAEYFIWLPQTDTKISAPKEPLNVQKAIKEQLGNSRFPVLYLLHGASGSGRDFADNLGKSLQKIADGKKVIIVAPSCEPFGWYVNSPLAAENQIADFITKELIPHIDSLYPSSGKRSIAGLSMGGHGALLLGFRNKSLFRSMAGISAVMDIRVHKDSWKIKSLLGEYEQNQKIWDENSVLAVTGEKWPATSPKQIIVTTGTQDNLVLEENRRALELFRKRGFTIDYTEAEGTHSWDFWRRYIPQVLEKQADYLNSL